LQAQPHAGSLLGLLSDYVLHLDKQILLMELTTAIIFIANERTTGINTT
jgi:hypothetical protein